MTAPRTIAEIFCHRRKAEKTAELRRDVSHVVAQKEPDTMAAPVAQLPSAGAAVHSAAWFLLDLGLTDEEARRIEQESFLR